MNVCWHQLWPEIVNDFNGFPNDNEIVEIVRLPTEIGGERFDDM